jgi:hypothetical protein
VTEIQNEEDKFKNELGCFKYTSLKIITIHIKYWTYKCSILAHKLIMRIKRLKPGTQ